jgi:hypothetical protein
MEASAVDLRLTGSRPSSRTASSSSIEATIQPIRLRAFVLVVMPRSAHPRPQAVRMLEHEYSLRGELDPAWALRPLALTTLEGRPASSSRIPVAADPSTCRHAD